MDDKSSTYFLSLGKTPFHYLYSLIQSFIFYFCYDFLPRKAFPLYLSFPCICMSGSAYWPLCIFMYPIRLSRGKLAHRLKDVPDPWEAFGFWGWKWNWTSENLSLSKFIGVCSVLLGLTKRSKRCWVQIEGLILSLDPKVQG